MRQVDLAAALGVPQSHVSKYETGERRVEFVMLEAICAALEVPLAEFLERWQAEDGESPIMAPETTAESRSEG